MADRGDGVGDLHLATVVINVQDMRRAVDFWAAALGLDLYTGEQGRHIERLIGLGALRVDEWPYPEGADFVVLRDPDGNEFCVIDQPEL